jgi:tetratricopeptide (TPR) repeat protein
MIRKAFSILLTILFLTANVLFGQVKIWYANGEKALFNNQYDKAIENFSKVLSETTNNAGAYYYRGLARLYKEEYDKAVEDFDAALGIQPKMADAYNSRGLARTYLGEMQKALDDFNKAIEYDPDFTQAYLNRGSAYIAMGKKQAALDDLTKALKSNPNNPAVYYQRGRIYYKNNEYSRAISDYNKCLELGLVNPKIYYNRGNAYYQQNKYEKAVADYTKALELDPNDTQSLNNRAMAYDKMGRSELARADRDRLNKMTGNQFPPVESLNFVKYSDPDNRISIEMPKSWHSVSSISDEGVDMIIAAEEIESINDFFASGVKIYYSDQMEELYEVTEPQKILEFWQSSIMANSEEYASYDILSRKTMIRNGWNGIQQEALIKLTAKSYPIMMYEYALAHEGKLFFAYFQAPEVQFPYYKKIFDKAIETIKIN